MARQKTSSPSPSRKAGSAAGKDRITELADMSAQLAALEHASLAELREAWAQVSEKAVPRVRRTLLRLALAWQLQASLHGGLSRRTEQRLAYLAGKADPEQKALPGMRLVREWNGTLHTVSIDAEGTIHWQDQTWRSLSEIARVITGTRWSGPAFFGLKQRNAA